MNENIFGVKVKKTLQPEKEDTTPQLKKRTTEETPTFNTAFEEAIQALTRDRVFRERW